MMGDPGGYDPLPASRPLPPDQQPRRHELVLGDGCRTSVFVHLPAQGTPKRWPVVYAHGIQSHPGWFSGSAHFLVQRGHGVYQFTRRGSGDSSSGRGHAHSLQQTMEDVACWRRFARRHSGQERLHLLGVSWGGKLLSCFAAGEPDEPLASLVLVAPGLAPRVDVGFVEKLSIAGALLTNPNRCFDIPLSDPELFTDNPAMLAYLRDDPYCLRRATARFLHVSRQMDRRLARSRRGCLHMPTWLLLATRDRIINNARTTRLVRRLTDGRAVERTLEGSHTLEFEEDPMPFYRAIASAFEQAENRP